MRLREKEKKPKCEIGERERTNYINRGKIKRKNQEAIKKRTETERKNELEKHSEKAKM